MTATTQDRDHSHDHVHGHVHDHGHVQLFPTGEEESSFWLEAGEAYTGLRTSLQLLAGLQLLGAGTGERADLRGAVLLRVRLLLDEVRERLHTLSAPGDELLYLAELVGCCGSMEESVREWIRRSGSGDPAETARRQQLLERVADRLRRCQRYDLGLRFFGSGGCADIEHTLSHLRSGRSSHD